MGCIQTKIPIDDNQKWIDIARKNIANFDTYSQSIQEGVIIQIRYNHTCNS